MFQIEVDLHEAKEAVENTCLLGGYISELHHFSNLSREEYDTLKKHLNKIDAFLQNTWSKILAAQTEALKEN